MSSEISAWPSASAPPQSWGVNDQILLILANIQMVFFLDVWTKAARYTTPELVALAPYDQLAHTAVLSSFVINVCLQLTHMVSPGNTQGCADLMAFVNLFIGLHMSSLIFRIWQTVIKFYRVWRNQSHRWEASTNGVVPIPNIPYWRRMLESEYLWWGIFNLVVWITIAVATVQAKWRAETSCIVGDSCRIDLGQAESIIIFVISICSYIASIITLKFINAPFYNILENLIMLTIQLVLLGPALILYADAHKRCDVTYLNVVRLLIIVYNICVIFVVLFPVAFLNWNKWMQIVVDIWHAIRSKLNDHDVLPQEETIEMRHLRPWPASPTRFDANEIYRAMCLLGYHETRLTKEGAKYWHGLRSIIAEQYSANSIATLHGEIPERISAVMEQLKMDKEQYGSAADAATALMETIENGQNRALPDAAGRYRSALPEEDQTTTTEEILDGVYRRFGSGSARGGNTTSS